MKWNLTRRRKFLASLGTLGVATAGGLTIATDPARATDHTTTNGEGLVLDWVATRNGQSDAGSVTVTETAFTYSVSNILPKDYGTLTVEMSLTDGTPPSVPKFAFDLTETAENALTNPEQEAGDTSANNGELQDHIDVKIFYDEGMLDVDAWGAINGDQDPGEGLIRDDAAGTLAEVADALPNTGPNGVVLDADPNGGDDLLTDQNSVAISFGWVFSDSSNINETQSDSVEFDLIFYTEGENNNNSN